MRPIETEQKREENVEQAIYQHTYDNGLTLLAEHMPHVRSAAMSFRVPAGCIYDPPDQLGVSSILSEIMTRGAGERDSREMTMALDNLGIDRSESVGGEHMRFWGATVASNIFPGLELFADILRRPRLPADELEAVRSLSLQEIRGLEDDHSTKLMLELRKQHLPPPISNDYRGTTETVSKLTYEQVQQFYARQFSPKKTILSVTGNIDWDALRREVERLFGDWEGDDPPLLKYGQAPRESFHIDKAGLEQTHIGVVYDSVPFGTDDYYQARGAVGVLSGNMSSRLFTEIREKEGLCYSVGAAHRTFHDRGTVTCYVGSRNEVASRSLEKLIEELQRLEQGVEQDEVDRVQAGLKSALIMQQESTVARAADLALDYYYLGRVRSFDEIQRAIESLTPASIVDYVKKYPPEKFTIITLGPEPLRK